MVRQIAKINGKAPGVSGLGISIDWTAARNGRSTRTVLITIEFVDGATCPREKLGLGL